GRRRARRRPPVLRARLLRARQRLLPRLGPDQPRARRVPGLDRAARALDGERRGVSPGSSIVTRWSPDEMMAVPPARRPRGAPVCSGGMGLPGLAATLARRTHAPGCVLIYESGTIGAKPELLPLSIGDGELAETALSVVSVPEIFAYWLQGGRIDVGFL